MGTEIFPLFITLAKVLIFIVGGIAALVSILAGIQIKLTNDHTKKEELKTSILNSLIALTVVVIVYVILIGIGPAFRIIFGR